MMYLFSRFPIIAYTHKMASKCKSMNNPGPNEKTDLKVQNAFKIKARTDPV